MKKLNPNDAPAGYVAVESNGCGGCAFEPHSPDCGANQIGCGGAIRKDGCYVIFVKRETPSEPLDARLTIRLPASVKAKAQRIGAAAVIAAIVAAEDVEYV